MFGIPERFKKEGRWRVLPGAPLAFIKWNEEARYAQRKDIREAVQGFDDAREMRKNIVRGVGGDQFSIEDAVLEKVEQYYCGTENGQKVRGFLSFPLLESCAKEPLAFGVVNLHCDEPIFLGGNALTRQEDFAATVAPFVFDTAFAVKRWLEIKER